MKDHCVGGGEVDAETSGFGREKEQKDVFLLGKLVYEFLPKEDIINYYLIIIRIQFKIIRQW